MKWRFLNYRINKQIELDKDNWIIAPNHHEAIICKEIFDKVQDILDNYSVRINRKGTLDNLTGFIKCNDCKKQMRLKNGKINTIIIVLIILKKLVQAIQ